MELLNTVMTGVKERRSEIALVGGILCYSGAIFVTRQRTLKADAILEKHKKVELVEIPEEPGAYEEKNVTKKTDIFLAYLETYWMVGLLWGLGTFLCIGSHKDMLDKLKDVLMIYSITQKGKHEYEDAAKEVLSPKKEEEIRHKIAEKGILSDPVSEAIIIDTGRGHSLFRDHASGRYFWASREWVDSCKTAFNDMLNEMAVTGDGSCDLNDWYEMLGLPSIDLGQAWTFSQATGLLRIDYSYVPVNDDRNCTVIFYSPLTYFPAGRDFMDY